MSEPTLTIPVLGKIVKQSLPVSGAIPANGSPLIYVFGVEVFEIFINKLNNGITRSFTNGRANCTIERTFGMAFSIN